MATDLHWGYVQDQGGARVVDIDAGNSIATCFDVVHGFSGGVVERSSGLDVAKLIANAIDILERSPKNSRIRREWELAKQQQRL